MFPPKITQEHDSQQQSVHFSPPFHELRSRPPFSAETEGLTVVASLESAAQRILHTQAPDTALPHLPNP